MASGEGAAKARNHWLRGWDNLRRGRCCLRCSRFAWCGWAGVGQGLRVRRRDLWILGDFCSFSGIFGKNLTVFIYFDKERRSNSLRKFFPRALAISALGKNALGGRRANLGCEFKSPSFCTSFYHTNTLVCTLGQQFYCENVKKIKRGGSSVIHQSIVYDAGTKMTPTRHFFG